MAEAYGLKELRLPEDVNVHVLDSMELIQGALAPLFQSLDVSTSAAPPVPLVVSLDTEWNISRTVGVSVIQIAPHDSTDIYIIPVCPKICVFRGNLTHRAWRAYSRSIDFPISHLRSCASWSRPTSTKWGVVSRGI